MTGHIFIVISLALAVSLCVVTAASVSKEACLANCDAINSDLAEGDFKTLVMKACTDSCQTLMPSTVPSPTEAPMTAKPTVASAEEENVPTVSHVIVSVGDCEWRCQNQYNNLKAVEGHDDSFVTGVLLECKRSCLPATTKAPRSPTNTCDTWASDLSAMYTTEQSASFVDTLKERALSVCQQQ